MSGTAKRSLLQVEPTRLVELAAESEGTLAAMVEDWNTALDDLSAACTALGDAQGTLNVTSSYADSLTDAGEVVKALAQTLGMGVAGLLDAAHDAVRADDTVAAELDRTTHLVEIEPGPTVQPGGR
ncbi:hypothetical protein SFC79_03905 [Nocardioides sp. S-58]|uniref:Excreted virulence factor EspC (Type VII ESX diderm) n=1 Tax=Nocardioides renjunii TaxID=3095075 RepID=A0ABU5K7F4_9ACTN|nr:hypothetical protein [Nocardioides sp. S-58]MDZ5660897.1 hypothetical protein [Nocardioides sp. S-58]